MEYLTKLEIVNIISSFSFNVSFSLSLLLIIVVAIYMMICLMNTDGEPTVYKPVREKKFKVTKSLNNRLQNPGTVPSLRGRYANMTYEGNLTLRAPFIVNGIYYYDNLMGFRTDQGVYHETVMNRDHGRDVRRKAWTVIWGEDVIILGSDYRDWGLNPFMVYPPYKREGNNIYARQISRHLQFENWFHKVRNINDISNPSLKEYANQAWNHQLETRHFTYRDNGVDLWNKVANSR